MLFSSTIRSVLRKANFPDTLFDDDDIQAHRAVRLEAARGPVGMAALANVQPALEPYPVMVSSRASPASQIRDLLFHLHGPRCAITARKSLQLSSRRNMQNETTGQVAAGGVARAASVIS
jgi:hypothetical protein